MIVTSRCQRCRHYYGSCLARSKHVLHMQLHSLPSKRLMRWDKVWGLLRDWCLCATNPTQHTIHRSNWRQNSSKTAQPCAKQQPSHLHCATAYDGLRFEHFNHLVVGGSTSCCCTSCLSLVLVVRLHSIIPWIKLGVIAILNLR